jgi:hypothetical protein
MNILRNVLLTTATVFALATPALAQNISMELSDRQAMYVDASGKVSRMDVSASGHKMMMRYARPVSAGTIFYMSGGKLYMAMNRPTSGGRGMLVDEIH